MEYHVPVIFFFFIKFINRKTKRRAVVKTLSGKSYKKCFSRSKSNKTLHIKVDIFKITMVYENMCRYLREKRWVKFVRRTVVGRVTTTMTGASSRMRDDDEATRYEKTGEKTQLEKAERTAVARPSRANAIIVQKIRASSNNGSSSSSSSTRHLVSGDHWTTVDDAAEDHVRVNSHRVWSEEEIRLVRTSVEAVVWRDCGEIRFEKSLWPWRGGMYRKRLLLFFFFAKKEKQFINK